MSPEQNFENSDTGRQGKKRLVLTPERLEALEILLSQLPPREATILRMIYGLEDGYLHTKEEVAHKIGVNRERIRQLETMALKRLGENSPFFSLLEYMSDENQSESKSDDVPGEKS